MRRGCEFNCPLQRSKEVYLIHFKPQRRALSLFAGDLLSREATDAARLLP